MKQPLINKKPGVRERTMVMCLNTANGLKEHVLETIVLLKRITAFRDNETAEHVERIGSFSCRLAMELGLPDEFCRDIYYASQLHDIGKIGIPDSLIYKEDSLTEEEFDVIKKHTLIGNEVLRHKKEEIFEMARQVALHHHERWDGTGYPEGLAGHDIPLSARIVSIADQYDALRSSRPYKRGLTHNETCEILLIGDGRTMPGHFDPEILSKFVDINMEIETLFDLSVRKSEPMGQEAGFEGPSNKALFAAAEA